MAETPQLYLARSANANSNAIADRLLLVATINYVLSAFNTIYEFSYVLEIDNDFVRFLSEQYDAYFFLFLTMNAYSIVFLSKVVREEFVKRWSTVVLRSKPCNAVDRVVTF
ncbi:hypothetical protein DICVIV_07434 [Dictyocaulus viviparus]|uniref:7TM GPCR serpentine receptor class x (Srx) domain-containing protein n=1 Tax=Dictyocaulus viviparus TaxID=29172 RepID=A0A0D8XPL6_DICVI|nr:hypothetical protein DICVIV_07434 [Dictyocaulus viviparus]